MTVKSTHQATCSAVARIFKEEREKRGLSLSALAERAGLSYQMIAYVERESRNPSLQTMLRIAGALEISLAQVIKRAEAAANKIRL